MDTYRALTIEELLFKNNSISQLAPINNIPIDNSLGQIDTNATFQTEANFNTRITHFLKRNAFIISILVLVAGLMIYTHIEDRRQGEK
jgi:hypothetical protein